jgi:hypothetical protein
MARVCVLYCLAPLVIPETVHSGGRHGTFNDPRSLVLAREHVALGEKHITPQREIISGLGLAGHDTVEAELLLKQFEELQVQHTSHRDRLEKELASES